MGMKGVSNRGKSVTAFIEEVKSGFVVFMCKWEHNKKCHVAMRAGRNWKLNYFSVDLCSAVTTAISSMMRAVILWVSPGKPSQLHDLQTPILISQSKSVIS